MADRTWNQSLIVKQQELSTDTPWLRIRVDTQVPPTNDGVGFVESISVLLADQTARATLYLHVGRDADPFAYVNGLVTGDRLSIPACMARLYDIKWYINRGVIGGLQSGEEDYWYYKYYDSPAAGSASGGVSLPRADLEADCRAGELWIRIAGINDTERPSIQVRGWKILLEARAALLSANPQVFHS